jgi:hypothetical protein
MSYLKYNLNDEQMKIRKLSSKYEDNMCLDIYKKMEHLINEEKINISDLVNKSIKDVKPNIKDDMYRIMNKELNERLDTKGKNHIKYNIVNNDNTFIFTALRFDCYTVVNHLLDHIALNQIDGGFFNLLRLAINKCGLIYGFFKNDELYGMNKTNPSYYIVKHLLKKSNYDKDKKYEHTEDTLLILTIKSFIQNVIDKRTDTFNIELHKKNQDNIIDIINYLLKMDVNPLLENQQGETPSSILRNAHKNKKIAHYYKQKIEEVSTLLNKYIIKFESKHAHDHDHDNDNKYFSNIFKDKKKKKYHVNYKDKDVSDKYKEDEPTLFKKLFSDDKDKDKDKDEDKDKDKDKDEDNFLSKILDDDKDKDKEYKSDLYYNLDGLYDLLTKVPIDITAFESLRASKYNHNPDYTFVDYSIEQGDKFEINKDARNSKDRGICNKIKNKIQKIINKQTFLKAEDLINIPMYKLKVSNNYLFKELKKITKGEIETRQKGLWRFSSKEKKERYDFDIHNEEMMNDTYIMYALKNKCFTIVNYLLDIVKLDKIENVKGQDGNTLLMVLINMNKGYKLGNVGDANIYNYLSHIFEYLLKNKNMDINCDYCDYKETVYNDNEDTVLLLAVKNYVDITKRKSDAFGFALRSTDKFIYSSIIFNATPLKENKNNKDILDILEDSITVAEKNEINKDRIEKLQKLQTLLKSYTKMFEEKEIKTEDVKLSMDTSLSDTPSDTLSENQSSDEFLTNTEYSDQPYNDTQPSSHYDDGSSNTSSDKYLTNTEYSDKQTYNDQQYDEQSPQDNTYQPSPQQTYNDQQYDEQSPQDNIYQPSPQQNYNDQQYDEQSPQDNTYQPSPQQNYNDQQYDEQSPQDNTYQPSPQQTYNDQQYDEQSPPEYDNQPSPQPSPEYDNQPSPQQTYNDQQYDEQSPQDNTYQPSPEYNYNDEQQQYNNESYQEQPLEPYQDLKQFPQQYKLQSGGSSINYHDKYKKYKLKYLNLLNQTFKKSL